MNTPSRPASPPPASVNRPPPPPDAEERALGWVKWIALLFVLAAGGAGYYMFFWKYRLPQEHTFTNSVGQRNEARIEARIGDVLKYTLLSDGTTRYIPIASLPDDDKAFAQGLKISDGALALPIAATITNKKGELLTGEIAGRNLKFIKLLVQPGGDIRYVPFDQLSESDAAWLRLLPSSLSFSYPFEHTLTFADGRALAVNVLGRSDKNAKIVLAGDKSEHVYPLNVLSTEDQAMLRAMPINLTLNYPVDVFLVTKEGRKIEAQVQGRTPTSVRFLAAGEKAPQTIPLEDFDTKTQEFLLTLQANLTDDFSADRTLTDAKGQTRDVRLLGRSDSLVKYALQSSGQIYFYPIAMLGVDDQQYVRRMTEAIPFDYPLEYTLTDAANGSPTPIRITALTTAAVKYTVPPTGRTFDSALGTLSPLDQTIMRLMPPSPVSAQTAGQSPAEKPLTIREITQEAVNALKNSGTYGAELNPQILYNNGPAPREHAGTVYQWLQRIRTGTHAGEDYGDFMRQRAMIDYIRTTINTAITKLRAIRVQANAAQVDGLITNGTRALEALDTITRGSTAVNRGAVDRLNELVQRWEVAR